MCKSSSKRVAEVSILENVTLNRNYFLLKCVQPDGSDFPTILAGQFAEIEIAGAKNVFLRRPISFAYADRKEVHFLVRIAGKGTAQLATIRPGDRLNIVYPLGNSFTLPQTMGEKCLLIGGGVGIAPMYALGKTLKEQGIVPVFLVGARSKDDLLLLAELGAVGEVFTTTEDGSMGEKGFVTNHSLMNRIGDFQKMYACGPEPMMKAVGRIAHQRGVFCEVSLENNMACGIGVCLCCVENTVEGHKCVCSDGPVFNIDKLRWNEAL